MRGKRAAATINRSREEVERLWRTSGYRPGYIDDADASVTFTDAPGGRGTEIHVDLHQGAAGGRIGEAVAKLTGSEPLAKVKDDLRRFKQLVETGVVARSDGTPEGLSLESQLKQRPAQPLDDRELEQAGVR